MAWKDAIVINTPLGHNWLGKVVHLRVVVSQNLVVREVQYPWFCTDSPVHP